MIGRKSKENGPKPWKDIWSAGHGVGSIKKIESVAQVVETLKMEYRQACKSLHSLNLMKIF